MDEPNIVVKALVSEYKREHNRLQGAARRLVYAETQVANESQQFAEHTANLALLTEAITDAGGELPVEPEGEEPYAD